MRMPEHHIKWWNNAITLLAQCPLFVCTRVHVINTYIGNYSPLLLLRVCQWAEITVPVSRRLPPGPEEWVVGNGGTQPILPASQGM